MGLEEFGDNPERKNKRGRLHPGEMVEKTQGGPCSTPREEDKLKRNQWSIVKSGQYLASALTVKTLLPGVFTFHDTNLGIVIGESPLNTDDLIDFPDSVFDSIEQEVDKFWEIGDNFKKYGFLHRRGYLFYGPAGSGKSCLVQRLIRNVINKEGIVFLCGGSPGLSSMGLQIFREVEPNRKIICVFEDIDAIVDQYGESDVLSLLDGENQVDKVINIATTNYPERLDKRIVARPRRFDRIIKIDMPEESIREVYFKEKLKLNGDDVTKWVKATDKFSFASLAELVISVKCLGNKFDDAVERLKDINKKRSSREFEETTVGFGVKDE